MIKSQSAMSYQQNRNRFEAGFTLVELMVTMVIFVIVIAAASGIFTGLLTQFKQQSRIAETNIEGIIGLEILRYDIEHAGYGLPWGGLIAYTESAVNPFNLNDSPNPPRAIVSWNDIGGGYVGGTDYLVIKALNVAKTDLTANSPEKWTLLKDPTSVPFDPPTPFNPREWGTLTGSEDAAQTLQAGDRVIVFEGPTATAERVLVTNGGAFYTTYGANGANLTADPWQPREVNETRLVYGLSSASDPLPVRPFNRADYFVQTPAAMPRRCAAGTGILYKAIMSHDAAGTFTLLPLLDCVADMQVGYALDNNEDGSFVDGEGGDAYGDDITVLTAQQIRTRVKEVRVYILAHEGQRDTNYTYPNATITVGESGLGRIFTFAASGIADWQNYRWKLYTLVAKPNNLR
jgi:prepilin-type N-terminal cleavage/methylation domain-containing protein